MNCDLVPCRMSTPLLRDWMARSAEPQADRSTVPPIPSPIGRARHAKAVRASCMSSMGLVSRVSPVHTAMRNCTRDEGRSFEVGNQVLISSHRKLLSSKAMVV